MCSLLTCTMPMDTSCRTIALNIFFLWSKKKKKKGCQKQRLHSYNRYNTWCV